MSIQFLMESWENAEHDTPEICKTTGPLKISLKSRSVTRNEDEWSQTVKQTVRVSAYPIALWFAASWWRLRYEPLPFAAKASTSWRMSHEISASGYGFLWPQIVFACDGSNMQIWSIPTHAESEQPVRYLVEQDEAFPVQFFVDAVDTFMNLVLDRLDAVNLKSSELKNLWEEVLAERADAETERFRQIEAMLGFDPDELNSDVVENFVALGTSIGSCVLGEIASACSSDKPMTQLERIKKVVSMTGTSGKFSIPKFPEIEEIHNEQRPWIRGRQLAHALRNAVGLNGRKISDSELSDLAEIGNGRTFFESSSPDSLPIGMAVHQKGDNFNIVLRKRNRAGRRFELARLLCDYMLFGESDEWLPAADTRTIRQKLQRAFAAEFLCPIDSLVDRLDQDFSDDSLAEAANHFGVSEMTVTSQLVNHNLLHAVALDEKNTSSRFPYLIMI